MPLYKIIAGDSQTHALLTSMYYSLFIIIIIRKQSSVVVVPKYDIIRSRRSTFVLPESWKGWICLLKKYVM